MHLLFLFASHLLAYSKLLKYFPEGPSFANSFSLFLEFTWSSRDPVCPTAEVQPGLWRRFWPCDQRFFCLFSQVELVFYHPSHSCLFHLFHLFLCANLFFPHFSFWVLPQKVIATIKHTCKSICTKEGSCSSSTPQTCSFTCPWPQLSVLLPYPKAYESH